MSQSRALTKFSTVFREIDKIKTSEFFTLIILGSTLHGMGRRTSSGAKLPEYTAWLCYGVALDSTPNHFEFQFPYKMGIIAIPTLWGVMWIKWASRQKKLIKWLGNFNIKSEWQWKCIHLNIAKVYVLTLQNILQPYVNFPNYYCHIEIIPVVYIHMCSMWKGEKGGEKQGEKEQGAMMIKIAL